LNSPSIQATLQSQGDPDLVLGLDPGSAIMGFGLVRVQPNGELQMVEYGAITTPAHTPLSQRLLQIYQELTQLLGRHQPGQVAIEELFFNKNITTAIAVGQARGVALLVAAQRKLDFFEYTPLQVKQALVGYGRATKDQVQQMVRVTLDRTKFRSPTTRRTHWQSRFVISVAVCTCNDWQTMSNEQCNKIAIFRRKSDGDDDADI